LMHSEYYHNLSILEKKKFSTFKSFKQQVMASKIGNRFVEKSRCGKRSNYLWGYVKRVEDDVD